MQKWTGYYAHFTQMGDGNSNSCRGVMRETQSKQHKEENERQKNRRERESTMS